MSSEKMALLGWPEEVFYRRLQSIVDDYGRYEANPQLLRSKCYPLQVDAVRVADITRWMAACQKAGLILVYVVQNKQYLEICNFGQQQRTASKFPEPPPDADVCNQLLANAHLGVSVSVFGVGVEVVKTPAPDVAGMFAEFWKAYPKKKSKDDALKAFTKRKPTRELLDLMLKALAWQCKTDAWLKDKGQFIPYPATWLNDGSWQDEPATAVGGVSLVWHESAAGVDAKAQDLGLDPIGNLESRPAFKARVMAAAREGVPA